MILFGQPLYRPYLRDTITKSFLNGNKQNKIKFNLKFSVKNIFQGTSTNKVQFVTSGYVEPEKVLSSYAATPVFTMFNVGDVINISGSDSNDVSGLVIMEKISNSVIRVDQTLTEETSSAALIENVTPPKRVDYYFNFIENSEPTNYISKTDEVSPQLARAFPTSPGVSNFAYIGNKSWQIGSATLNYTGYDQNAFQYEIEQELFLTPFYVPGTISDIEAGIKEAIYQLENCLKHVVRVQVFTDPSDPNFVHEGQIDSVIGNTGAFDENFNSNHTNYYIEDLTFLDYWNETIDSIELPTEFREDLIDLDEGIFQTSFSFKIRNTADSPFTTGATKKVVLQFMHSLEKTEIVLTKTIIENNVFDRAVLTSGDTGINGENYGGDQQALFDCALSRTNDTTLLVTGKIAFTATQMSRLRSLSTAKPILSASVFVATGLGGDYNNDYGGDFSNQDGSGNDGNDTVTLKVLAADFYSQGVDPDLFSFETKLAEHPDADIEKTSGEFFPGDRVVLQTVATMDTTGRDLDKINFKKAKMTVVAEKTDGTRFVLDQFIYDFTDVPKVAGLHTLDYAVDRPFILPSGDIRREIAISGPVDAGDDDFEYTFRFPIEFGDEYWVSVPGANNEFYNISDPQNGKNNFWFHYQGEDWAIKYRFELIVDNDGVEGTYLDDSITMEAHDFDSNSDWEEESIDFFTTDDAPLVDDDENKYILGYADTKVVATFIKQTDLPDLSKLAGLLWARIFEGIRLGEISTEYDLYSLSIFKNIEVAPRLVLDNPEGNTITLTALIDYTKLPSGVTKFMFRARLYNSDSGSEGSELTRTVNDENFNIGGSSNWSVGAEEPSIDVTTGFTVGNGYETIQCVNPMTTGEKSELVGGFDSSIPGGTTVTIRVTFTNIPLENVTNNPLVKAYIQCGGATSNEATINLAAGVAGYVEFEVTLVSSATTFKLVTESLVTGTILMSAYTWVLDRVYIISAGSPTIGAGGEEIEETAAFLIPENPVKKERLVAATAICAKKCPYVLNVLASAAGGNDDTNDHSAVHFWGTAGITGIEMILQRLPSETCCDDEWEDVADLNDDTYGTYYGFNFVSDDYGKKYAGYWIDWQKVLQAEGLGAGKYRVMAIHSQVAGDVIIETWPAEFCLRTYREHLAEGTVIIRAQHTGLHGKADYPQHLFAYGENWKSEFRLRGIFGFDRSGFTEERTIYAGSNLQVQYNKTMPMKYTLELFSPPGWMLNLLRSEILQSNFIQISDFNPDNTFYHNNRPVILAGPFEPQHDNMLAEKLKVEIEFEDAHFNQTSRPC